MKELSIEEKAKAYDEVRDKIALRFGANVAKEIFSQFEESKDERIRKYMIKYFEANKDELSKGFRWNGITVEECIDWLEKQIEQNPAWSEEDNIMAHDIDYALRCQITYPISKLQSMSTWINNLKNRIQLKQEWSKEDESHIRYLIECLEYCKKGVALTMTTSTSQEYINWLKSLRPQNWTKKDKERYISCLQRLSTGNPEQPETINSKWFKGHVYPQSTWKPSLAQMNALSIVSKGNAPDDIEAIVSLYNDLKKLKEE